MSLLERLSVTARKPFYVAYYRWLFGRRFPGAAAAARAVRRFEERTQRGDISVSASQWDDEYKAGRWRYLAQNEELARYDRVVELLERRAPGGSVLDIGCGEGLLRDRLRARGYTRFLGVDIAEEAVRAARQVTDDRAEFVVASAETYTPDGRFDAVVFNECLYYFDDPLAVVERYLGSLTGRGVVVVSMWSARRSRAIQRLLRRRLTMLEETPVAGTRGAWLVSAFSPIIAREPGRGA
jgi:SAM-dependent methyltransferase